MRTPRTLQVIGLAVVMTLSTAGIASAQVDSTADEEPSVISQHIDRLCARVPQLEERVQHALDRINGDADTFGSIAWLEARADEAAEAGYDDWSARIRDRIDVRTERIDVLENHVEILDRLTDECAARQ